VILFANDCVKMALQLLEKLTFYSSFDYSSFAHVRTFRIVVCTLLVKKLFKKIILAWTDFTLASQQQNNLNLSSLN